MSYYSIEYSRNVVSEFHEKYSRATNFFARKLNITIYDLLDRAVYYFQNYQRRWETFKKIIKTIEKYDLYDCTDAYIKEYYTFEYHKWIENEINIMNLGDMSQMILDIDKHFDLQSISDEVIRAD